MAAADEWEIVEPSNPQTEVLTKQADPQQTPGSDWEIVEEGPTGTAYSAQAGPPTVLKGRGSDHPILDDRGAAFAQGAIDMAMPLSRYAAASGMKAGGQVTTIDEGMDRANAYAEDLDAKHPFFTKAGQGVGLFAGGLVGGLASDAAMPVVRQGLSKLTASKTAETIGVHLAELAGMSMEGGAISVLNDQPKTWEEAVDSYGRGASIAFALGLGVKGIGAGLGKAKEKVGNALEELDNKLTNAAKVKQEEGIEQARKAYGLKEKQVTRSEEIINRRQNELDLTKSQLDKTRALVEQEPFINERVAKLPNKVNDLLDAHMREVGTKKSAIVQQIADQRVDATPAFKKALDKLNEIDPKTLTPQAEAARQQSIAYINKLDQKMFEGISPTDSLIGVKKGRDINIGTLDQIHDQIQGLVYDRGFLQNAPKGTAINKITKEFERDVRNVINSGDPTGELAVYNEAYHNLRVAKDEDALHLDNPRFFMQKATDPHNPALTAKYDKFESNLKPESEGGSFRAPKELSINPQVSPYLNEKGTSEFGGKLASVVYDKKVKQASKQMTGAQNAYSEMSNRFKAIRDLVKAESEPAMMDYKILQEHKPKVASLESKILSLEDSLDNSLASLEGRKLSAENAGIAVKDKELETPTNALESLLPAKVRVALNARRKINENQALVEQTKNSIMQSGGMDALRIGRDSLYRGAVTRLPSAMGFTKSENPNHGGLTTDDYEIIDPQSSLRELK